MHNSDTVHIQLQDAFILPTEEELKLIRKLEEIDKKQRFCISFTILITTFLLIVYSLYYIYSGNLSQWNNQTNSHN